MSVAQQIEQFIISQPASKQADLYYLHQQILQTFPACKLWFLNGKNSENQVVTNPTIGYGNHTIHYANGKSAEWFQLGISATSTGISVYILGVKDKTYLAQTFGKSLGKANISGYCIKFKSLKDLHTDVLTEVIRYGFRAQATPTN
ncbi:MAG: DUF1801 domain-containing protein [Spirosomataceae bacterium]